MSPARKLIWGSAWNLAGQAVPLVVAIAAIPWLIRWVGLDRFGFIALAWVLIGYASLFDLGIGRALIRTMSARLAQGDTAGADGSGRTGLTFLLALGLLAAALTALATPLLIQHLLQVPPALQDEAQGALFLLALSLPFVMLTSGYVAVLSAHQDFKRLNLIRGSFSVLSYLLPLALAGAGWVSLPAVVGMIVVLRIVGTLAFALACSRRFGFRWRVHRPDRTLSLELLSLGGWMSVSNIVSPLLSYLDRLLIGALVPLRGVGIYAAPYDLLSRLMVLPYAVMAAFFPAATAIEPGGAAAKRALCDLSRYLFLLMFPLLFVAMALAQPAMGLWLGPQIGAQAALVLQILVVGVFCNALAQGPATLIQAAGRPRDMAMLHLFELPLFLLLLWQLTARWGITGTAIAATLRLSLDAAAVFVLALRGLVARPWPWRGAVLPALLAAALLALAQPCSDWAAAAALIGIGGAMYLLLGWKLILLPEERQQIVAWLASRRQRPK